MDWLALAETATPWWELTGAGLIPSSLSLSGFGLFEMLSFLLVCGRVLHSASAVWETEGSHPEKAGPGPPRPSRSPPRALSVGLHVASKFHDADFCAARGTR